MGTYISLFEKSEEESKIILVPNKGDFITGHADLTGLAVVEVQRLWTRFRQLGSDKKGYMPKKMFESGELGSDLFIKNIMANLPKEKDGSLSFLVFLKFVHWLDTADEETKLKIMFHFLNNGKDLEPTVLEKFFTKLYPNNTVDEIRSSVSLFMKQLDTKKTGRINETQFVTNVLRLYPEEQVKKMLDINIIPQDVLNETNMQPSMAGSQLNMRNDNKINLTSELDDRLLESVASKAIKKDWEKLAIKLGFLEYDIQSLKNKHKGNAYDTLLDIFIQWRDQDPYLATKNRLRRYLEDSNMMDAASLLK